MASYEVIVSILVILFGFLVLVKPAFFMHVFRPKGALTNDPTRVKTFFQVHGTKNGILLTKITGIIFVIIGIVALLKYGFGLF